MKSCKILGVNINITNINETVEYICTNLSDLKGNYICISNVHTTVMAYENDTYRHIQNSGAIAIPDGAPLSIISKIRGFKEAERVTGPDLMGKIFEISELRGYTHYFYGSTQDTLDNLRINLRERYPNLNIVGMYSPPFRDMLEDEDNDIIRNINNSKADFVWVGLGAPKQEVWMFEHKNKINSVMLGVGAGFDYFAGKIQRAPIWMQRCSLEWLYRLIQEPKRLFKRYLKTNLKFIMCIITGK